MIASLNKYEAIDQIFIHAELIANLRNLKENLALSLFCILSQVTLTETVLDSLLGYLRDTAEFDSANLTNFRIETILLFGLCNALDISRADQRIHSAGGNF